MKRAAVLAAAILLACVRTEMTTVEVTPDPTATGVLKAATNLPPQFSVVTPAPTPGDCPPRLRDEGLATILLLQRSTMRAVTDTTGRGYRAFGDYSAEPRGRYGEQAGEGLRVDCSRLRALGIITL